MSFGAFDLHDLQAAFTRPVFVNHLVQSWLPALGDVHDRLARGEPVRIAEVGCGEGMAAITIAKAFPNAQIDGFDLDDASIAVASADAAAAGVHDRVRFHAGMRVIRRSKATTTWCSRSRCCTTCPTPSRCCARCAVSPVSAGMVVVADERTEDQFKAPGSEMERFLYAFSPLHCLAVSMQDGGAGTGTVMRADTVRRYAADAGFRRVDVLDVDHPQFRLYRLT